MSKYLNLKEVIAWVRLSKATIYRLMKVGKFPEAHKLGVRAVRWRVSDIEEWLEQKRQQR